MAEENKVKKWVLKFAAGINEPMRHMEVRIQAGRWDEAALAVFIFNQDVPDRLQNIEDGLNEYKRASNARRIVMLEPAIEAQRQDVKRLEDFEALAKRVLNWPNTAEEREKNAKALESTTRGLNRAREQLAEMEAFLKAIRAGGDPADWIKADATAIQGENVNPDSIMINASELYRNFNSIVATADFDPPSENEEWPHKKIKSRNLEAKITMQPPSVETMPFMDKETLEEWQEKMLGQVQKLGDEAADILDVITAKWLANATHPQQEVWVTANEILEMRGIKKRKIGGFEDQQRKKTIEKVFALAGVMITVEKACRIEEVKTKNGTTKTVKKTGQVRDGINRFWKSHAVNIAMSSGEKLLWGEERYDSWLVKPGSVFIPFFWGPGRQFTLLSCLALQLDPYRQRYEKRLLRYLSWIWRAESLKGDMIKKLRVKTLLEAVKLKKEARHPERTRTRLESALDTLQTSGTIKAWQYEGWEETSWETGGWGKWVETLVLIEPPQNILEMAVKIRKPGNGVIGPKKKPIAETAFDPAKLKETRLRRGLSQLQTIEILQGIIEKHGSKQKLSRPFYSLIESGKKEPKDTLKRLLSDWCKG
jgi:hypothetical protein